MLAGFHLERGQGREEAPPEKLYPHVFFFTWTVRRKHYKKDRLVVRDACSSTTTRGLPTTNLFIFATCVRERIDIMKLMNFTHAPDLPPWIFPLDETMASKYQPGACMHLGCSSLCLLWLTTLIHECFQYLFASLIGEWTGWSEDGATWHAYTAWLYLCV